MDELPTELELAESDNGGTESIVHSSTNRWAIQPRPAGTPRALKSLGPCCYVEALVLSLVRRWQHKLGAPSPAQAFQASATRTRHKLAAQSFLSGTTGP